MEEDYDEFYEDDEMDDSESLILAVDENGKASIYNPDDYVEMLKEEAELVKEFIDLNKKLFEAFVETKEKDKQSPNKE